MGFFSTLPGITLMLCLWLSPVKFSYLNFPYFVRHPIEQADLPLLTKTLIKEVGFFISNPSWFKIDVRPSLRWAEAGWQMMICDYVNCPLCVMSVGVSQWGASILGRLVSKRVKVRLRGFVPFWREVDCRRRYSSKGQYTPGVFLCHSFGKVLFSSGLKFVHIVFLCFKLDCFQHICDSMTASANQRWRCCH